MRRAMLAVLLSLCVPLVLFGQRGGGGGSAPSSSSSSSSSGGYSGSSSGSESRSSSSSSGSESRSSGSSSSSSASSGSSSRGDSGGSRSSSSGGSSASRSGGSGSGSRSASDSSSSRSNVRRGDSSESSSNSKTGEVDRYAGKSSSASTEENQSPVKQRNWFTSFLIGKRDPKPDAQSDAAKPCLGSRCKPGPPPCEGKNCRPGPPPPVVPPPPPGTGTPATDRACSEVNNSLVAGCGVQRETVQRDSCDNIRRQLADAQVRLSLADHRQDATCSADPQSADCNSAGAEYQSAASLVKTLTKQLQMCQGP